MVSIIMTVLNEAPTIGKLLDDIRGQSLLPGELVIVDGGSVDDTVSVIRGFRASFPIRLIKARGANRSEGRNIAIRNSRYDIIAVTDGGVRLHRDWLRQIVSPMLEDPSVDVVTGMTFSKAETFMEKCFSAIIIHNRREIEGAGWIDRQYYRFIYRRRFGAELPSSRSLGLRKQIWDRVGGYPAEIPCSEDMVFNVNLRKSGARFHLAEGAVVYWSPRNGVRKNFRYFFKNALWDGISGIFLSRSLLKMAVYVFGVSLAALGAFFSPWALLPLLLGAFTYGFHPSVVALRNTGRPTAALLTPFLLLGKDISQNTGYAAGLTARAFPTFRARFRGDSALWSN